MKNQLDSLPNIVVNIIVLICPFCNKVYKKKSYYEKHVATHEPHEESESEPPLKRARLPSPPVAGPSQAPPPPSQIASPPQAPPQIASPSPVQSSSPVQAPSPPPPIIASLTPPPIVPVDNPEHPEYAARLRRLETYRRAARVDSERSTPEHLYHIATLRVVQTFPLSSISQEVIGYLDITMENKTYDCFILLLFKVGEKIKFRNFYIECMRDWEGESSNF